MSTPPIAPSTLQLPPGPWATVLDGLCARFPAIDRARWLDRIRRGRVLLDGDVPVQPDTSYRVGLRVRYFREVAHEPVIPFGIGLIHADEHLVVVDKPHFLPVMPAGRFVEQTVLGRLVAELGRADLVPLHRIDRLTAGLVLFSASPASRGAYQALFRERRIDKVYEAMAAPLPALSLPLLVCSRIVAGEPFFRMGEAPGEPNSEARISVIARTQTRWRYRLEPVTGRKHQLRVQMAGLGAPIEGDPLYPTLRDEARDDYARPLQLLAQSLAFVDPLSSKPRRFTTQLSLKLPIR